MPYLTDAQEGDIVVFLGHNDGSFCDFAPGEEVRVRSGRGGRLTVECICGAEMDPHTELDAKYWRLKKMAGPW